MNDIDQVRAIRVPVRPIPAAPAMAMRNRIDCSCLECNRLRKLLDPVNNEQTEHGELSLVACSTLFKLAIAERCDVCLMYAQEVCRSAGDAIAFCGNGLTASAKHQLDESHAIDRDRLDAARIGIWFELALSCLVGAERAAELYRVAARQRFCVGKYLEEHCDEFGLAFVLQTSAAMERAAVDFLIAINENPFAEKTGTEPRQDA